MGGSNGDIRPISRNLLRFDVLPLFVAHIEAHDSTLHDVQAQSEFLMSVLASP